MLQPEDIAQYCDQLLSVSEFEDYCPNGLQVDGGREISRIVTGVTATEALIDAAIEQQAQAILVHHGYFWKGESAPLTGMKGRRVRKLMQAGISLLAYHLPLDANPELGNNFQLGKRLKVDGAPFDKQGLLWGGEMENPATTDEMVSKVADALGRQPLLLAGGSHTISRVAWCTGAAQGYIEQAARADYDVFISGEVSEQTMHQAAELGIHYLAAGHHATERDGIAALGGRLAVELDLKHQFIDLHNPV
ncbi:MAG: Nif3-like dinuclear metal center hexameric protein [bacterium]